VAGRDFAKAREMLGELIKTMPKGWKPLKKTKAGIQVAFWSQEEFFRYTASKATDKRQKGDIVWVGPSYSRALFLLGMLDAEERKYDEALVWLDKALALEPDHPAILGEKGFVLSTTKRHKEAIEAYRQGLERDWAPQAEIARLMRGIGVCLVDLKQLEEAEAWLKRSLELDPDSVVARKELEYIKGLREGKGSGEIEVQSPFDEHWYHKEPERIEMILDSMAKRKEEKAKPKKKALLRIGPFTINEDDLMP